MSIQLISISKHRTFLMGIAIVSILLFHYGAIFGYYDAPHNIISLFLFKGIGAIGVDIFALLSGIGVYYSLNRNSIGIFLKHRISRILPSYIIIGGLYWLITDLFILRESIFVFIYDYSLISFWHNGENRFWYVAFALLTYFVSPIIYRFILAEKVSNNTLDKKSLTRVFVSLGGVVLLIVFGIIFIYFVFNSVYMNTEIALKRLPVFLVGMFIGKCIKMNVGVHKRTLILLGSASVIFFAIVKLTSFELIDRFELSLLGISICILISSLLKKKNVFYCVIEYIGSISFELYLSHIALIGICIHIGINLPNPFWYLLIIVISFVISASLKQLYSLKSIIHNNYDNGSDK